MAFISYVRSDMVIERLFSRVPKEDASFSNWGISWWKLKDKFDAMMEERNLTPVSYTHLILLEPHQVARIMSFLHPENYADSTALQTSNSIMAYFFNDWR